MNKLTPIPYAPRQTDIFSVKINPLSPVFFVLAAALVLLLVSKAEDPLLIVLAGLNALFALLGVIRSITSGLRPIGASILIFWFAWLGVGQIAQLTLQQVAWGDRAIFFHRGRVIEALAITLVSVVVLLLAEAWGRRHHTQAKAAPVEERANPVRGVVLFGLAIALLVVSANAIRTLGLGTYFSSRAERSAALAERGLELAAIGGAQFALLTTLPVALSVSGLLLALYRVKASWYTKGTFLHRLGKVNGIDALAFAYFFAAACVFANPLTQNRFTALTAFGSLLIVLFVPRSRKAAGVFAVIGFTATLFIYPLANVFRGGNRRLDLKVGAETFTTNDFDGFQVVIRTISHVQDLGYGWGTHILSAIGYFIPRSIWEGKEVPASLDVAGHAGYFFTNLSMPIHAEFYLEFGWVGMIAGMALVGYGIGRLDSAWQSDSPSKLFFFVPYIAMASLGFLRGPLGSQAGTYLTVTLILFIALRRQTVARDKHGQGPLAPGFARSQRPLPRRSPTYR